MTNSIEASLQWRPDVVLKRLQDKGSDGRPVSAQVFMSQSVEPGDLSSKAHEIVEAAALVSGLSPGAVRVGKVFPLARSFSVSADSPNAFTAIVNNKDVSSILESEQPDIMPKPLDRSPNI